MRHSETKGPIQKWKQATCDVEFSFNNTMYKQVDGVAMGSPLGPTLANIFVGFHENRLFSDISETPIMYHRYVDDTFTIFRNATDCELFFGHLNTLHPAFHFGKRA